MKHIFLINPAAGLKDSTAQLRGEIAHEMDGMDYEIHVTRGPGDAGKLVAEIADKYMPCVCRFYACGGDGTLSEALHGVVGRTNVELACIPCGTGNDFIRLFDRPERFRSITAQAEGLAVLLDVMRVGDSYAINECNAGLDARIAHWVVRNKRKCPFGGGFPYKVGILVNFFRKINRRYHIEIDGESLDEEIAVIIAANGRWYGGGCQAVPEAEPDDGLMDIVCIRRISRFKLIRFIGAYFAGHHAKLGAQQFYRRAHTLKLRTEKPEPICFDGEIRVVTEVSVEMLPGAVRFVIPEGAALLRDQTPV